MSKPEAITNAQQQIMEALYFFILNSQFQIRTLFTQIPNYGMLMLNPEDKGNPVRLMVYCCLSRTRKRNIIFKILISAGIN